MGFRRAGETKRAFAPRLEIGVKNQIFLDKRDAGILIPINWFDSCNEIFFYRHETHTAQESGSQFQCHAVMSLQLTQVPSFAWRGGLRKSRVDCSAVHLYCMRLLNADLLAANAARLWHADSGKSRTFILCEKKHEWVCSNASTSLKNPLLVGVWSMCLSVKLHLCRLLFMQYKITWLLTVQYIYAGLWEYILIVKV